LRFSHLHVAAFASSTEAPAPSCAWEGSKLFIVFCFVSAAGRFPERRCCLIALIFIVPLMPPLLLESASEFDQPAGGIPVTDITPSTRLAFAGSTNVFNLPEVP
jgi:hypothetical protein